MTGLDDDGGIIMLTIKTDNKFRNLLYGYELTPEERREFDYIDPADFDSHDFFRYKGRVYDLGEFMRCELNGAAQDEWSKWDGYSSDSAFSGILVKYSPDFEQVKIATYYS